ncbi:MAG: DUF1893 domain-containing protein [Clostridia bacterium]|nr:DUF1893 domain-containing protein [Clostridia bacterium]
MSDILTAKDLLKKENATFVAVNGEKIFISHSRGVAPIIEIIDSDAELLCGASVADKVIGKAAAMLLSKYKVKEIHALLVSEKALEYLDKKSISVTYDNVVAHIINRNKTDMCPMEKCVLNTTDEDEAEELIRRKRQELMNR